ncbi:MAG: hypothetical protein OXU27_10135 [Candidatus Poribacteria bacterium]|nr:hypothetical protein [Candidatus Poribacteria bacterium]
MRKSLFCINYKIYFDKLRHFIRHTLQGWELSLIISVCLAGVILTGIFVFKKVPGEKIRAGKSLPGDMLQTLNLVSSTQLGVPKWQIGDYTAYQYRRPPEVLASVLKQNLPDFPKVRLAPREVKFHIIGELSSSGQKRYWMRVTGLSFYRDIPRDIYRLVSHTDLRVTPETPQFNFVRNYIPTRFETYQQTFTPMATLVKIGEVELETPAGRFECIHYRVEVGGKPTLIEIWVNPKISPRGIVRISTPKEILELTSYGQDTDINIPELIQPVIEGISTLKKGCNSCHGSPCHEFISPPL